MLFTCEIDFKIFEEYYFRSTNSINIILSPGNLKLLSKHSVTKHEKQHMIDLDCLTFNDLQGSNKSTTYQSSLRVQRIVYVSRCEVDSRRYNRIPAMGEVLLRTLEVNTDKSTKDAVGCDQFIRLVEFQLKENASESFGERIQALKPGETTFGDSKVTSPQTAPCTSFEQSLNFHLQPHT